jgi:anthranilate phosphoribosyltransferase
MTGETWPVAAGGADGEARLQDLAAAASSGELGRDQVAAAAEAIVDPAISAPAKATFLRALAQRGETPAEIAGFVNAFLALAVDPCLPAPSDSAPILDVVGTGGDKLNLFNVSTTAMFILAGGGVRVVKHGNRGVTSKSGGADVLEALGVRIDLPPDRMAGVAEEAGLCFLFAPLYHPAFKAVVEARKLLAAEGPRSMFNLLGPLLNPARPDHQLVGVFDAAWMDVFAEILRRLGRKRAWVVHGEAGDGRGMDELSTLGATAVRVVEADKSSTLTIQPAELGIPLTSLDSLVGGDADQNASLLTGILSGQDRGARRDIALLNAAAGFVVAGLATGIEDGLLLAAESVDSGRALASLDALRRATRGE